MFVNFNILNQLGSPAINSNTFANRPAAGQTGRLFVSTDTFEIYRDNGTSWDLIGGPGTSTITGTGTATQVAYFTSSQAIGSSANLFWDNTNGFLGVATAVPTARIEAVKTDGYGIYANYTTVAGSGSSASAIYAINTTASSGYAAVIEERTGNTTGGQYPLLVKHSLSSGTAAVGNGTGLQFQLQDDAGTFKTTQLTIETIDAAAATYSTRYRFNVQSNGSSTPMAYLNATGLGIKTATPLGLIHADGGASAARIILDADSGVAKIFSFRTDALPRWAFRVDGAETGSNAGADFALRSYDDTGALLISPLSVIRANGKASWQATETYSTGLARANYFDYNLSVAAGASFSSPNAITALGASLDLTLAGNATIPSGSRSGLDAYNTINFTGTGTLTQSQGTQIRAYSNLTAGWSFSGAAAGTITHLAGLRVLFPDAGSAGLTITNNYGLLINDQSPNTGVITYTNRWGIYQEGGSDLNYFAANVLIGSTVNNGDKLQVNGAVSLSGNLTVDTNVLFVDSSNNRVGIGTTTLTNKLTTIDSQTGTQVTTNPVGKFVNTGNVFSKFILGSDNANYDAVVSMDNDATLANTKLRFYIGNGTGSTAGHSNDQFVITGNNNIGIGTATPAQLLHLATQLSTGSGVGTAIQIESGGAGGDQGWIGVNKGTGNGLEISVENRDIIFNTGATTPFGGTERARISNTGNFLVGTQSNTSRLIVVGGNSNTGFEVDNGVGYTYLQSYDRVAATHRDMYFYTTGPATMVLKNSGNLLIGTTTDAGQKLQVSGNALFSSSDTTMIAIKSTNSSGYTALQIEDGSAVRALFGYGNYLTTDGGIAMRLGSSIPFTFSQGSAVPVWTLTSSGNIEQTGSIKTAAPTSGTAAAWKLGSRVAATVVVNTTEYIEVDIGGTLYKLATVT